MKNTTLPFKTYLLQAELDWGVHIFCISDGLKDKANCSKKPHQRRIEAPSAENRAYWDVTFHGRMNISMAIGEIVF